MAHHLCIVTDTFTHDSNLIWKILEKYNPQNVSALEAFYSYLDKKNYLDVFMKEKLAHTYGNHFQIETNYCTWLTKDFQEKKKVDLELVKDFPFFGNVELSNPVMHIDINGYPMDQPLIVDIRLPLPVNFCDYDLEYRNLCREVIRELAKILASSKAIFFDEDNHISDVYSDDFAVYEYGRKSEPIDQFIEALRQNVRPPKAWDYYEEDLEEDDYSTTYFVDDYRS